MKSAEHARAMKELERVLIENSDWITEKVVRELMSSVGLDYDRESTDLVKENARCIDICDLMIASCRYAGLFVKRLHC